LYAYKWKYLRINLRKKSVIVHETPKEWIMKYLGGRGFAARAYYDEIGPTVDPMGPDNKLIFFTGPLTGTPVFSGSKCSVATKSPLTGIYLCSNAAGFVGAELKFAGYEGLIVEDRADEPTYLSIVDDQVGFRTAKHLWGLDAIETQKAVKEDMGEERAQVMSIGQAGERGVKFACIMSDERSYGRGGAGAVMGSKNLKAIAVRGHGTVQVANLEGMRQRLARSIPLLKETTSGHTEFGTLMYVEVIYETGSYPIKNFQVTRHEGVENVSGFIAKQRFKIRNTRCFGCPVACGQLCEAKEGRYRGCRSRPEYEIAWAFGPHCGIFDFNPIITAIDLSNRYGVDGISMGYTIGLVMELYERDIIPKERLEGIDAKFGNEEAMFHLIHATCQRRGIGNLIAEGARRLGQAAGKNASYYAMHMKGMEFPAYEPRAFYGMGLAYATSSRGACHNVGGWTIRDELIKKTWDRFAVKGKARLVKTLQDIRGYIDSIGICTIPRRSLQLTDEPKEDIVNFATGMDFTGKLVAIGERIYNLERVILNREGIARKHDTLPPRIEEEAIHDGPAKGHIITFRMLQEMLDEYYQLRGWTSEGEVPSVIMKRLEVL